MPELMGQGKGDESDHAGGGTQTNDQVVNSGRGWSRGVQYCTLGEPGGHAALKVQERFRPGIWGAIWARPGGEGRTAAIPWTVSGR